MPALAPIVMIQSGNNILCLAARTRLTPYIYKARVQINVPSGNSALISVHNVFILLVVCYVNVFGIC